MNSHSISDHKYYIGGSLPVNASTYVVRQADQKLFQSLREMEFCYVLNSRQMGKSSLRVRMMQQLEAENIVCIVVDLAGIGSNVTMEQWYWGIAYRLMRGSRRFAQNFDCRSWWEKRKSFSPIQRLSQLIEEVLLELISPKNLVIFIDEIDSVRSLDFSADDFFTQIRFCYESRGNNQNFYHLTFCLLGVATPTDLIADQWRTPFNIGQSIELTGFQLESAKSSLIEGFASKVNNPELVLEKILYWTGGQPLLTQQVCKLVAEVSTSKNPDIGQLVDRYIINNWESQDEKEHFKTIRKRLLGNEKLSARMLSIYQKILVEGEIKFDSSPEQMELILSGLVTKKNENLIIFNPIYGKIFNKKWAHEKLENLRPPLYREAIKAWLNSENRDKSYLLGGESLLLANKWANGKFLSNEDYLFLNACQENALSIKAEETRILEKANQVLDKAKKKAERIIKIGVIGSMIVFMSAVSLLLWAEQRVDRWPEDEMLNNCTFQKQKCRFEYEKPNDVMGIGGFYVNLITPNSEAKIYWSAQHCHNQKIILGTQNISTSSTDKNYIDFPRFICSFSFTIADMSSGEANRDRIEFKSNYDIDQYPLKLLIGDIGNLWY